MKPTPDSTPEWESLIQGFLEASLSKEEEDSLSQILEESPEAEEAFVRACELHAMLEAEPEVRAILEKFSLPENVVSLESSSRSTKDVGPSSAESKVSVEKAKPISRTPRIVGGLAAAFAIGVVSYLILHERDSGTDSDLPSVVESLPEEALEPPRNEADPQTQYERASLAALGAGSQERPPTNFTVEPSIADGEISYNRDIRPILSDNCFSCHGPDEHGRKAELRLDTYEGATDPELATIVPGDPEASELMARILSDDEDDIMPPPESHKKLTATQIDLLTRWVKGGAEYEEHWAFLPILNSAPEDLEGSGIDWFVDQRLEKSGLTRAERAKRSTLLRRVTLDLTGLPPTPAEVKSFLEDESPDAFEKRVDELLARRSFGEHRARYWLDAARYGDTHGLHLDNYREMWPYRDWVIRAFNENMPFDQFTIEQIAGDLLPNPTQNQRIATGFNRCNVTTSEGGAIEEEFLVRYAVDRVATTGTVWMGLTAGCAQCHDHKFDPMTMKDFYSLFAFFNNTTQPGMDGNAKDSRPVIRVYDSPEEKTRAESLRTQIAAEGKNAAALLAKTSVDGLSVANLRPDVSLAKSGALKNGTAGNFRKEAPFTLAFRFDLPNLDERATMLERIDPDRQDRGWRVYWEDKGIFIELIEEHPNKILKTGLTRRIGVGSAGHFAITYDGSGNSNGIALYQNGKRIQSRFQNTWLDTLEGDFETTEAPLTFSSDDPEKTKSAKITELILSERLWSDTEIETVFRVGSLLKIEKTPEEKRKKGESEQLKQFLATHSDGPYRGVLEKISTLRVQLQQIESASPTTLVMEEKKDSMPKAHLLLRGEYDQKAEEVEAAFPAFLPPLDETLPNNRLGLAKWLVHPDHPLTARVTVNRIWQELFGVGLVKTSEDFGTQGENPSHPRLLDYLASRLIASGWDVKKLYRDIVLSETYRQSSAIPEGMAQQDPENRLLARGPRFRLDAEVIRDQALHVSGLLDNTFGGMGVRPYQPAGIWKTVGYSNSNTQSFFQDYGSSAEHRRSIYTFWKRTAHSPNLAIFDAPNREICIMRRERTNTPLQALVMMNDPQFVRAARYLAKRVLVEETERDARIDLMGTLLRGSPFTEEERQVVVNSFDQFRNIYESDLQSARELLVDEVNESFSIHPHETLDASEFAAWTMVANQLLNLDESLNKN